MKPTFVRSRRARRAKQGRRGRWRVRPWRRDRGGPARTHATQLTRRFYHEARRRRAP
jgi:hypothetical protein